MIGIPLKPKFEKIKSGMVQKHGDKKGASIFWSWVNKQGLKDKVEQKSYTFHIGDLNLKSLENEDIVEGYIVTGDPDRYKDIITEECMDDIARQLQTKNLKVDLDHENVVGDTPLERGVNQTKNSIARVFESARDKIGVHVKTILNKAHPRYAEIKSSIKNRFIDAYSIAYFPIEYSFKSIKGVKHRLLHRVDIVNVAFTGIPVNDGASFTKIALKSLEDIEYDEKEINQLVGGIIMADEDKTNSNGENPPAENPDKGGKKTDAAETKSQLVKIETETKSMNVELKSVVEKVEASEKSITELKSLNEEKDKKIEEMGAEIKSLQENYKAVDDTLSKPQVKARLEEMAAGKLDAEIEKKSDTKGTVDLIR